MVQKFYFQGFGILELFYFYILVGVDGFQGFYEFCKNQFSAVGWIPGIS
jgi:hypothetical protein